MSAAGENMGGESSEALIELESQLAFQEHTIEQLNQVLISQQQQMNQLQNELKSLKEKFGDLEDRMDHGGSVKDEKPPHY